MLPSIGYASAARPATADRTSNSKTTGKDSQSKASPSKDNPDNSFDQVFSSTVSDSSAEPDAQRQDKAQSGGAPTASDEASLQQAVAKASDPAPSAAKQPDAQPMDTSATAVPKLSASVPPPKLVSRRPAAQAPSTEPVRRLRNSPPATAGSRAEQAAALAGSPLDPSSLLMLLGAGTARIVTPVAEPGAAAKIPETVGSDKEAQPVTGLAPQTPRNAKAPEAGLAFALRLSREPAVAPESDSSSTPAGSGASLSSFVNELEAAAGKAVGEAKMRPTEDNAGAVAPTLANADAAAPVAASRTAEPEAAPNVAPAAPPELPSQANAPLRAVRVQLAAEGNQRVDLTLVERAGALSVSVRSADSNLARSLQEHLPDLSARLGEQRYQTETWTPRVELPSASAGSAGSGESGSRNFESGGQKPGGQNGNSNPEQQQGRREGEAPAWFEELAAFGRTPHIRSEYLWVQ
jgi:hypothetical protein